MATERYHRQVILHGFGETAQLLLSKARVLVIGAGGIGCPALQYLAAAGVGCIGIADDDTVALSNLHRQVLFNTEDIDKPKVRIAKKRLEKMNPEIEIISHPVRLERAHIIALLKDYDYVLDGTDNFESRYLINDACVLLGKPLIFAAVSGFEGQLAIFNVADKQGQRCNYRDIFPIPPQPGEIAGCAENGVLGVLPGIIGTMAAAETIKLITGIGRPLINQLLQYNLLSQDQYKMNISPGDDYAIAQNEDDFLKMTDPVFCALEVGYTEIDAEQLLSLQKQSTIIVDVRERHELPILNEQIYKKAPMTEFPTFLDSDIEEENMVFICQHGIRSILAAQAAQEKYGTSKNIYSLIGGIANWKNYFLEATK
ncbi:HesA/MoeB/ThiF family protein [Pedobacter gandavensis]|uniref:Molybdopterin biosynthesis protein n=1 Tax=Pedobacter gandavensis TaxID=2679963 RepID=A0ABR6ES28_9SPHI|nr:HesA/MoeB/ThiF family protein [Pedobacter gandavensis]MBB2148046.1 molybdopterin biosynthesis protein [Pedobacter gandavensis]